MESAEKEIVEFVREIVPEDAKGLVEKWLLQVTQLTWLYFKHNYMFVHADTQAIHMRIYYVRQLMKINNIIVAVFLFKG